jgi:hypothetical protein
MDMKSESENVVINGEISGETPNSFCKDKSDESCQHSIIEDLVDISPDCSKYVYYCEKCLECFTQCSPSVPLTNSVNGTGNTRK